MELRAPGKRDITLGPVTPNVATEAQYKRALKKAVTQMAASYEWWLKARYRVAVEANADVLPEMAHDAKTGKGAASALYRELTKLRKYWTNYFNNLASELAPKTVDQWYQDNSVSWGGKLRRAGFDVEMKPTEAQKLIISAKVTENVALIKSIQQDYHTQVEGIVLRGFLAGRDLATVAAQLKERHGVSVSRAALIARDQSNKATAQMNAARQKELGLNRAVWIHSSAGKVPRKSHLDAGRQRREFDTQVGIDFHDGFGPVLPGEAINCRCMGRTIIPAIGRGAKD